ncbi:MAG: asparagine synthase-related protein [Actinomycetota bacterium]|nr:asparagine synthase-related protein [Actinomycetota bacterium]
MTFVTAVAAGIKSIDSLRSLSRTATGSGEAVLTQHRDLAVAWAAGCPWLAAVDDGDVLVVLDGRLHNLASPSLDQADALRRRYRSVGAKVATDLLGDFVMVILDRGAEMLLVARDPVGVRPWYQAAAGSCHAGASDVATLAALPWVDTSVNEHIAIEYLAAVEQSRGETLYRGIRTLPPGHTWVLHHGRARTFAHHRWELHPELEISWEDAAERCRVVLEDAVRCRVGPGAATSELSGGLDSSTVVGTLVVLGCEDLVVGRMVFDGPRADERAYSEAAIERWGLRAVSTPPWVPTEEENQELGVRLRRPCPDANFTMFTGLHRALLDAGRTDGLTGLGGDDAFVAYGVGPRVMSAIKLRQSHLLHDMARRAVRDPVRAWSEVVRPTLGHLVAPWRRKRLPTWVTPTATRRADLRRVLGRRPVPVTGIDAIDERLATLTSGYLASILETRALVGDWAGRRDSHPFLDPRFVHATYGLDPSWPTRGGHYRALQVEAFADRLPPAVARRLSKADFSEVFWPQVLNDRTLAGVRGGPLHALGWLDQDGFDALVTNAKKGMANAAIPLFRCVALDHWVGAQ